jgi:3-deoxy-D-glycero-D-galacto-nononate 9-phosphate synthase
MKPTYIIGEIGQNHNGSVDIAKLIVELVSRPVQEQTFGLQLRPMDAIKLQKRDLHHELTHSEMNKAYDGPNSFGKTYGEHREFLELDDEEHFEIFKYVKEKKLDMVETLCAPGALSILKLFTPDFLKVASRDMTNLPLIAALGETKIPIIISTGMSDKRDVDTAIEILSAYHSNISILHCVSEYPTHPVNVNLHSISYLMEHYPQYRIGYSDHTIGISAAVCAVAMGAEMIEKHVTIDRRMKGTDQSGSLGPDGVNRLIRDIRLTELSMGEKDLFVSEGAASAKCKLERSVASKRTIRKGEIITEGDLHLLSPGTGLKWAERSLIVGKRAADTIEESELISLSMVAL